MQSTLSAQQASCHFKAKLVILIFPKHKYYKNIMHLIGLTKCFVLGHINTHPTRQGIMYQGVAVFEDSLKATPLRTAMITPNEALLQFL